MRGFNPLPLRSVFPWILGDVALVCREINKNYLCLFDDKVLALSSFG